MDDMIKTIEMRIKELENERTEKATVKTTLCKGDNVRQFPSIWKSQCCSEVRATPTCLMKFDLQNVHTGISIWGLRGKFYFTDNQIKFHAQTEKKNILEVSSLFCDDSLSRLLEYLYEKKYIVDLIGKSKNNILSVRSIHIVDAEPNPKEFSAPPFFLNDEQFQFILKKQFEQAQDIDKNTCVRETPVFTSKGELKLLFEMCKESYPPNIRYWAEHNLQMLSSPVLGSTDKRHIQKALSYILNVDWSLRMPEVPPLDEVSRILNSRFYGLASVKQRILEIAAQIRQTHKLPKWGILLAGPAGIGKTSIANTISSVLNLPKGYIEFSVVRDSEGLTGSSRIYENAKAGLVIEQIFALKTASLVMVLNEIDKAANGKDRGNPLDTLLPLLDGMGFTDSYIETSIPTDGIFFIATCNDPSKISKPILDRFYRIDIPAYSAAEKEIIFDHYIMPRAMQQVGLEAQEVTVSSQARKSIISQYAIEPGVRDLEKIAEKLISNYLLRKEHAGINKVIFSENDICALLGPANALCRGFIMCPGMVFSAFCHEGSVHVFSIQALIRPGKGELHLINIDCAKQQEYCRVAYEHTKLLTNNTLSNVDVILTVLHPLSDSEKNYIGCAACVAILSALHGVVYSDKELFLGGCDLFGNLYLDEKAMDPFVEQLYGKFTTVYAAIGAAKLIYNPHSLKSMTFVETPNMSILSELNKSREKD